jgi:hypothetical protein
MTDIDGNGDGRPTTADGARSDRPESDRRSGILATLRSAVRLPGRVVGDIENVSRALLSLQRSAEDHLALVDRRAGQLIEGLGGLHASVRRLEGKVDGLVGLEATIDKQMDGMRADLNTRMLALEAEVREVRPGVERIARDVQSIGRLLPDPGDGPLARLKDTLTSS